MRAHSVTKNSRLLTHAVTTALFLSALATEISLAASGDLDSSFGAGGVVALTINDHAYATAVAVQDDDKIVAAGYSLSGSSGRIAVVRLDAVGDLDAAFGSAGVVSIPATNQNIGYAVALQSDANILVAGGEFTGPDGPDYDFRLVRLLASDGRLDASFGSGGIVATAAASRVGAAAIAVQADGKILVGGDGNPKPQSTSRNRDLLVVRYDTDGTLDSTYGVGGKAFVSMGKSHEYLNRLVAQTDGSVLAAGSAGAKSSWRPVATRLGSAGALDPTFGSGGRYRGRWLTRRSFLQDAAVLADGSILLAGLSVVESAKALPTASMVLARLAADGSRDTGFGHNGLAVSTPDAEAYYHVNRSAVQTDGKVVVAGGVVFGTATDQTSDLLLARFNTDGSLDASFGSAGVVCAALSKYDEVWGLALQDDGKIVVAGVSSADGLHSQMLVARFLP